MDQNRSRNPSESMLGPLQIDRRFLSLQSYHRGPGRLFAQGKSLWLVWLADSLMQHPRLWQTCPVGFLFGFDEVVVYGLKEIECELRVKFCYNRIVGEQC